MNNKRLLMACLLILQAAWLIAQTKEIKGSVVDENSEPLLGALVAVKGTSIGATTGADGNFTITVPHNTTHLTFSFMGYETIDVAIVPGMRVQMRSSYLNLNEVVVTGFQNLDKRTFTGSTVKLNSKDILNDGITDVSRMLEGKAAGVSVQNVSGTFGAAPKLRIRGATSINGDNKPLWVVDGVVLEDIVNVSNDQLASGDPTTLLGSSVAGLNANDIESIDILKDASATALYGARAMNGVIVITTKKGTEGRPVISYSGNFFIRQKPLYSDYNIMDSYSQMSIYSELERKGYISESLANAPNSGVYGKMYQLINSPVDGNFQVINTPEGRRAFLERYARSNTNWFDILFKNSLVSEHSLSISSGSERTRTYSSASFFNDPGWSIGESVRRFTGNLRNDYKINSRLDVALNIAGNYREQTEPGTLSRSNSVTSGEYTRSFDINPFSYALNTSRALTAYDENGELEYFTRNYAPFNIINELNNNNLRYRVMDVKMQGEATYKFIKNFSYSFMGNMRYVKSDREHMIKENSNMAQAYRANANSTINSNNPYLYKDPDNNDAPRVVVLPAGGFYNRNENLLRSWDMRNQINYKNMFAEKHDLSVIGGIQIQGNERQSSYNNGYGYQYASGGIPYVDYHIIKMNNEAANYYYGMSETRYRFTAFYANSEYTYNNKYAFSATARDEGSNLAGKDQRWLLTWNFGLRWNIMEESFMKPWSKVIDHMNIRTSYGLSAQAPAIGNATTLYYNSNAYRPQSSSDAETMIYISQIGNAGLTWEKSYQFNVGYNISLFNNRIDFMVEYWKKNNYDLIDWIKTAYTSGDSYRAANYSDLKSYGWEFTLGLVPVNSKNFSWRINLPFGWNTSEITAMQYSPNYYELTRPEGANVIGYPTRSLFSVQYVGLDHETGVPKFINESGAEAYGVSMYSTNLKYLVYEGQVDPKYTGGLNNTFRYRNFSLSAFITYQGGNKIRLYSSFGSSYSDLNAMPNEFKDRWILPGDERYTDIPSIYDLFTKNSFDYYADANAYATYNLSTQRVAKGDFVRLKTLSLTYNVPAAFLRKTNFINQAAVSLSGNNLYMIYSDKKLNGQDPEFYNSGGVAQPLQRQCIVSLKVGF
ncbi:MAG: SusC/RagA family TonB-linked outer membrane protein [Dysgonamonadaceae bacterium]|jgi:TonB-linked SusC/RagA family outer membrane protein|nr:SusC/RagA family TonB-linked outer membrane protein [Dysgonamonadaceae bacterium]